MGGGALCLSGTGGALELYISMGDAFYFIVLIITVSLHSSFYDDLILLREG